MRLRSWLNPGLVVVFFVVLVFSGAIEAQAPPDAGKIGPCTDENLEFSIHFYRAPGSTHVIALNYGNRGDVPCRLRVFRHQNGTVPQLLVHGQNTEIPYPRTTLMPGSVVHSSFRWKTEPVSADKPCENVPLRWILTGTPKGQVILQSRTLSPRTCDWLQDDDDYHKGAFVPEWKPGLDLAPPVSPPPSLAVAKTSYFENERLTLHVKLNDRTAEDPSCPVLLQTARDEQGQLRIDEVLNPENPDLPDQPEEPFNPARTPFYMCHHSYPYTKPHNEYQFQVLLGRGAVWLGLGKHTFGIIQLSGMGEDGEYRQVASTPVTIDVHDPFGGSRTWGKTEKGVRVDLMLDKLNYASGEDIPLHIALENVAAETPVYDRPFWMEGGMRGYGVELPRSVRVFVEDSSGPIQPEVVDWMGSAGSLPCPEPYPSGKPSALEPALSDLGLVPKKPGTYRIYVVWSPYTSVETTCPDPSHTPLEEKAASTLREPFVRVSSAPLTIHISEAKMELPSGR